MCEQQRASSGPRPKSLARFRPIGAASAGCFSLCRLSYQMRLQQWRSPGDVIDVQVRGPYVTPAALLSLSRSPHL
jgi:hypothetical protein